MKKIHLVLVRHGQSEWNKKNLFTGWTDIALSEKGKKEAIQAGLELKKRHYHFDQAFSSALKRAIHTMELILEQMGLQNLSQIKAWQLNERHYGALQGQNRKNVIDKYGSDQVHNWRRAFHIAPPPMKTKQTLKNKTLYKNLNQTPNGESLKDTQNRALPFWKKEILPCLQKGQSVLVAAHGNSLRALIKHLENISDEDIASLEIKTGTPIVYQLNQSAEILSKEILNS